MSSRAAPLSRPRVHLPRAEAVLDGGKRRCAQCGDFIDPIDWCLECQRGQRPCQLPHRALRKRADAAFCDAGCRSFRRSTYIRECL